MGIYFDSADMIHYRALSVWMCRWVDGTVRTTRSATRVRKVSAISPSSQASH